MFNQAILHQSSRRLSHGDILAGHVAACQVIESPGDNDQIVVPVSFVFRYTPGATPYAAGAESAVIDHQAHLALGAGWQVNVSLPLFIDQPVSMTAMILLPPSAYAITGATPFNQPVMLLFTGPVTGGDAAGVVDINSAYLILDTIEGRFI